MKISSQRPQNQFYVNWWLTDHCNWDCSYCHDVLKKGTLPFPGLAESKSFLDDVKKYAKDNNLDVILDITGGEVTIWPHLLELLEHSKKHQFSNKIRTNASQSVVDFASTIELLDSVQIDFHPEFTQTSHFLLCLNRCNQKENLDVSIVINALPERWVEIEQLQEQINNKWPHFRINLRMLFEDPIRNTTPMTYQEPQLEKIKQQAGDILIEDDLGNITYTDYQNLILEQKNTFRNYSCAIGVEQITVDAWGVVRRGHCRQGGNLGSLGGPINFDGNPIICKKDFCVNSFDILATKTKLS